MSWNVINGVAVSSLSAINGVAIANVSHVNGVEKAASGWAYLLGIASNHASGRNGASTASFNSTGAKLIVASVARWTGGTGFSISDSASNTWTPLTQVTGDGDPALQLFYCLNPTTSATHTVTVSGTNVFTGFEVAVFSGGGTYHSESGAAANLPGTVTPGVDESLIVCGFVSAGTAAPTAIDSGFAISTATAGTSSQSYPTGLAYLIQSTAAGVNPTWTGGTDPRAAAAVFSPS